MGLKQIDRYAIDRHNAKLNASTYEKRGKKLKLLKRYRASGGVRLGNSLGGLKGSPAKAGIETIFNILNASEFAASCFVHKVLVKLHSRHIFHPTCHMSSSKEED